MSLGKQSFVCSFTQEFSWFYIVCVWIIMRGFACRCPTKFIFVAATFVSRRLYPHTFFTLILGIITKKPIWGIVYLSLMITKEVFWCFWAHDDCLQIMCSQVIVGIGRQTKIDLHRTKSYKIKYIVSYIYISYSILFVHNLCIQNTIMSLGS